MTKLIQELIMNIAIIIASLFIIGQLFKNYTFGDSLPPKLRVELGLLLGFMGILIMFYSIPLLPIVVIDLRILAVFCATILGTPLTVLISILLIGSFRIIYFGLNEASFSHFILLLLFYLTYLFLYHRPLRRKWRYIILVVCGCIYSEALLYYLLSDHDYRLFVVFYYCIIYTLGAVLANFTAEYIRGSNRLYRELSYYRVIANSMRDMVITFETTGTIRYTSPSMIELLGYPLESLNNKSIHDYVYPEDRPLVAHLLEASTQLNYKIPPIIEIRLLHNQGYYIWVEASFKRLKLHPQEPLSLVSVLRDTTNRRMIQEELYIQKEEAIKANELKNQFLTNISHEIRTPLNSIIGFTTRVIKKGKDQLTEPLLENLTIVKTESKHLLLLIDDLLSFAQIESGKITLHTEPFNLRSIVEEAYTATQHHIDGKSITFISIVDSDFLIHSDRTKIKQILINLLSNAFKYSEKGLVQVSAEQTPDYCIVKVKDEGVGIDNIYLEQIFWDFHQIDGTYTRKVGGIGLGLALTKKLVTLLGGRICVDSTPNVGSTFTVTLPLSTKTSSLKVEERRE